MIGFATLTRQQKQQIDEEYSSYMMNIFESLTYESAVQKRLDAIRSIKQSRLCVESKDK